MAGQTFPFMDGSPEAEVCGIAMEKLVLPNGIEIKDAELTLNNLVGTEKEFYLNEANITNTDNPIDDQPGNLNLNVQVRNQTH
uniref:Uncharacterized protein n=1 Tax=Arion vulgaris TaxID=1028688 RepID=A0A0B7AV01_9EUPU